MLYGARLTETGKAEFGSLCGCRFSFVFGGYKRQRRAFYDRNVVTTTRWNVNAFVFKWHPGLTGLDRLGEPFVAESKTMLISIVGP